MNKFYGLLIGACLISGGVYAQTSYSENFDGLTAGSYLAAQTTPDWTTWGNAPGTNEDVKVSDADFHSAPNSIYFSSTSTNGGPTDIIKPFGGTYQTGQFNLEFWIKVESGKGAYMNIQGKAPLGNMFVMEWYWLQDGSIEIINGVDGTLLSTTYAQNQWIKVNLNIDLTYNNWELKLDDVLKGTFSNSTNQIYALDIFPYNPEGQAGYFIDDFSYDYTPYTAPALDLAVTQYNLEGKIAGSKHAPTVTVRNVGTTAITKFDIEFDYNGTQASKQITGVNIPSLGSYTINFDDEATLAATVKAFVATISNVNGGVDNNTANDSKSWNVTNVVPAEGKMVVGEEGTGTWCQWCPRGAVFMDKFSKVYKGGFVPIAVHNNDPMTVTKYDQGMGFNGYPNAKVDRINTMDPSAMESDINSRLMVAPKAMITPGAQYDATTNTLKISITAKANENFSSDYRLALVITEDSVTGTGNGYRQSNAYAGGNNGPMGGYENLPSSVPANKMVYDHVARAIQPSFTGEPTSFGSGATAGQEYTLNFTIQVPAWWNAQRFNIIGLLRAPNGSIDNAGSATLAEAIDNGFVAGTEISIDETYLTVLDMEMGNKVQMFPNPAQDFTNVVLNLEGNNEVAIQVIDMTGKTIAARNYGTLNGAQEVTIPTAHLNAGIYLININVNGQMISKRLIVE